MTDFIKKIEELESAQKEIVQKIYDLKKEWVNAHHPLKVGEIVTCNGFSHTGKLIKVKNLSVTKSFKSWYWTANGPVLKKNGTEGTFVGEWDQKIIEPI